ncbi:hypothetical protein B0I37DRAFT_418200 [Chaetomium sp. MPI-CAGE-AT-0009]|nr:hypothetical protein B0I37DRAFT_418200 [Chaetomium sp. MPI-CAGE-AT-0009]
MDPPRFPKDSKFWEVLGLEKDLMGLPESDTTLKTGRLKSMGIERAPLLDIDNDKPVARGAHPVFFQPLPNGPEFRKALAASRRELDELGQNWSTCTRKLEHWQTALPDVGIRLPQYPPGELPEWFTYSFSNLSNNTVGSHGMRHAGLVLADTTSHTDKPDEALRSEITAGVSAIRRQMWASRDTHSTIPVLVYSFYHNETCRITQMCWNGEHSPITFRQSRLVDISSKSLNEPDIDRLLRWMRCIPLDKDEVLAGQPSTKANHHITPAAAHGVSQTHSLGRPATPTGTRTQNRPGAASGNKTSPQNGTPPHTGTPTPQQRPPSAPANSSPPRPATPTPQQRPPHTSTPPSGATTGNTRPRPAQNTPTRQSTATGPATGNATGNASGAHTAVPRQSPPTDGRGGAGAPSPQRNNAPPPGPNQGVNLPTRNANANGHGRGGGGAQGHAGGPHTQ